MDDARLLWGINTALLAILGFFVKIWIKRLSDDAAKIEAKIENKLDILLCTERHGASIESCEKLFRHKHAPVTADGRGGEVVIPS